jgi:hypothetical protein
MRDSELVTLQGILKGDATCVATATKIYLPDSSGVDYVGPSIKSVSKELPEGNYDLSIPGKSIPMRYRAGVWRAVR